MLDLVLLLPQAAGGTAVIDEVEAGVFHANLPKLWRLLDQTSRDNGIQMFVTTHSEECVNAAIKAFDVEPAALRLHRISRWDDGLRVATYDHETVEAAFELRLEVR